MRNSTAFKLFAFIIWLAIMIMISSFACMAYDVGELAKALFIAGLFVFAFAVSIAIAGVAGVYRDG